MRAGRWRSSSGRSPERRVSCRIGSRCGTSRTRARTRARWPPEHSHALPGETRNGVRVRERRRAFASASASGSPAVAVPAMRGAFAHDFNRRFSLVAMRRMRSAISSRAWSSSTPHRRLDVCTDMEVEVHPRPPVSRRRIPCRGRTWSSSFRTAAAGPRAKTSRRCRFRHESPYVRVKQVFNEYGADCFEPGVPCSRARRR